MPHVVTRALRRLVHEHVARLRDPADLEEMRDWYARQVHRTNFRLRQLTASLEPLPWIESHDGERLTASIGRDDPPWAGVAASSADIPGMISEEEQRYYEYVGRFYSGVGAAVEIGVWLGRSTFHLVTGLLRNPRFAARRLHAFDAFRWHDYMDGHYDGTDRPLAWQSFRSLFDRYTAALAPHLAVREIDLVDPTDPGRRLVWMDGPIELCVLDCGRTMEVNEGWYRVLAPHFLPARTLIVMQDWGLHREIPERWYNQTKHFTDSKGSHLQLVHELAYGQMATFVFRGG